MGKVVPVSDERRGASLTFVVCDPGESPIQWRRRIRAILPPHEHPNRVTVVDEFPTTGTGKVDVARLRTL